MKQPHLAMHEAEKGPVAPHVLAVCASTRSGAAATSQRTRSMARPTCSRASGLRTYVLIPTGDGTLALCVDCGRPRWGSAFPRYYPSRHLTTHACKGLFFFEMRYHLSYARTYLVRAAATPSYVTRNRPCYSAILPSPHPPLAFWVL